MSLFTIRRGGTDITDKIISYQRSSDLCSAKSTIDLTLKVSQANSFELWDTVTLHEDSYLAGTFNVAAIEKDAQRGTCTISCQDNSKRLEDWFVDTQYITVYGDHARYYIDLFLGMCGVSYTINGGDGAPLQEEQILGLDSVYNLVMGLVQQSGWYMYFSGSGTCVISQYLANSGAGVGLNKILNVDFNTNDKMLRNRAVVWGGGDPENGTWVYADVYIPTPWDYDSNDKRTVVLANSAVKDKGTALNLANQIVNEFNSITNQVIVTVAGSVPVDVADSLNVSSAAFSGLGIIYAISSSASGESGQTTVLTLNTRCPRLFGYASPPDYVYIGTEGSGVWIKDILSSGWYDYSSGIMDKNIYDLYVANGIKSTTTYTGEAYIYDNIGQEWRQVVPSGLTDEYSGSFIPSGELYALVTTINHLTNKPSFGFNATVVDGYTAPLPEWRSWVVEYSPNDFETFSGQQVYIGTNYNYAILDLDTNDKNNFVGVETVGEFTLIVALDHLDSASFFSGNRAGHNVGIDTNYIVRGPQAPNILGPITMSGVGYTPFSYNFQSLGISVNDRKMYYVTIGSTGTIALRTAAYDTLFELTETAITLTYYSSQFPGSSASNYTFYAYPGDDAFNEVVVIGISDDDGYKLSIKEIVVNTLTGSSYNYNHRTYNDQDLIVQSFINGRYVGFFGTEGDATAIDVVIWERDAISGSVTFSTNTVNILEDKEYTSYSTNFQVGTESFLYDVPNFVTVNNTSYLAICIIRQELDDDDVWKYETGIIIVNEDLSVSAVVLTHKTIFSPGTATPAYYYSDNGVVLLGGDSEVQNAVIRRVLFGQYAVNQVSMTDGFYLVDDIYLPDLSIVPRYLEEFLLSSTPDKPEFLSFPYSNESPQSYQILYTAAYPEAIIYNTIDTPKLQRINWTTMSRIDFDLGDYVPLFYYSSAYVASKADIADGTIYLIGYKTETINEVEDDYVYFLGINDSCTVTKHALVMQPDGSGSDPLTATYTNAFHMFNEFCIIGQQDFTYPYSSREAYIIFFTEPTRFQTVIYQVLKQTVSGFEVLTTTPTRPYVELSKQAPLVVYDIAPYELATVSGMETPTVSGTYSDYLMSNFDFTSSGFTTYSGEQFPIFDARVYDILAPSGFHTITGPMGDQVIDYCYEGPYPYLRYIGMASSGILYQIDATLSGAAPSGLADFNYLGISASGVTPSGVVLTHLETTNRGFNPYFFVSTSGEYESGWQRFYQRNPTPSGFPTGESGYLLQGGFWDYSETLPDSKITIIRTDDRI